MRTKVLSACRELTKPGDRVVCALSGGGDSVALLHCLRSLQGELGITVSAAHFNHCLRGAESNGDEAFVRNLCQAWDVPLTVGRGDPRTLTGQSPEEAARNLRYEFLLSQPGRIATAHHADDQLETILLNLLRGTGLRGLGGMRPMQGQIIRPMLTVSRQEVQTYLTANKLDWRQDSTNDKNDALRNRLRHEVTPLLYRENPGLAEAVTRMTDLLQQDEDFLTEQTQALLEEARREDGYDCPTLLTAPKVLRRRGIRALLPCPKPAMTHVDAVEALLAGDGSATVSLPGGVVALREYDLLRFCTKEKSLTFAPVQVTEGESVYLPELKLWCRLEKAVASPDDFTFSTEENSVFIRPRQIGDSLRLSGGTKTLKKWMIDRKIPVSQRDCLPVVADSRGIIGVYGLGIDVTRAVPPGEPAWRLLFWKKGSFCHEDE